MYDCECPYCTKGMEDPDDCHEPEVLYDHECPHCGKNFVFTIDYSPIYNTHKAPCLNGAEHEYKKTITYPPEYAKWKCIHCEKEKP